MVVEMPGLKQAHLKTPTYGKHAAILPLSLLPVLLCSCGGGTTTPGPTPAPAPPSTLSESSHFLIIQDPADLAKRLSHVQDLLYQGDQGTDNPLSTLLPTTIALMPASEPYQLGHIKMGYYTALVGLGSQPDAVTVQGTFNVNEGLNSPDNVFFKSLENLKVDGGLNWTVAQSCPVRSVHITGNLSIGIGGGCGGFLAHSTVDEWINAGGQQQFLLRNVSAKSFHRHSVGQMNFVFLDSQVPFVPETDHCAGVTSCGTYFPRKFNSAPSVAVDSNSLPRPIKSKRKPSITTGGVTVKGQVHSHFQQVKSQDDFDRLMPFLKSGTIVLLHPNVYIVNRTVKLAGDDITILGLGFPILRSELSGPTIEVSGNGCTLASLIVDAPLLTYDQDVLIDVSGPESEIYDVSARTFLAWHSPVEKVKTNTMLQISGTQGFIENVWLWRGDHWSGPDLEGKSFANKAWDPYNVNPYGLVVTKGGSALTFLGAFVEHQLWNPIYWNGDDGVVVMSQGECAYTNNGNTSSAIVSGSAKPKAGLTPGIYLTIGANVKKHMFVGGGVYNVFGEMFTPLKFPAMEVLADITNPISVTQMDVAGWVGTKHFSSMLRYKGTNYGPSMLGKNGTFLLCDLQKLVGGSDDICGPTPTGEQVGNSRGALMI